MSFGLKVSTDRQRHPKYLTKKDRGKFTRERERNKQTNPPGSKKECFKKIFAFDTGKEILNLIGHSDSLGWLVFVRTRRLFTCTVKKQYNEQV